MKPAREALLLVLVALILSSGWFIAGYMVAETDEDRAYDSGLTNGKLQAEAEHDAVANEQG